MRAVAQRVTSARVRIAGEVVGEIAAGLLIFVGVMDGDTEADAEYMAGKLRKLRIFEDAAGKMNLSLADTGGSALVISQFTLYGDARGQNRPSFLRAAAPEKARGLYERLIQTLRQSGVPCQTGRFQELMEVELVNHGPVTILLDSEKLF